MGGRIDTILMCVKFSDGPISSLDFSFIGGVPLNLAQINSTGSLIDTFLMSMTPIVLKYP